MRELNKADQPNNMTGPTRDGNGRFARDLATAQRDADAARLRSRGLTYRQIAAELGVDVATAHAAVQRALKDTLGEAPNEVRQLELERLDQMWAAAVAVLERRHVHVSGGKVVTQVTEYMTDDHGCILLDEDGQPKAKAVEELEDDGPTLKAIETMLKIQARRAALLGLDAEQKINLSGGVRYEVVGVDLEDL